MLETVVGFGFRNFYKFFVRFLPDLLLYHVSVTEYPIPYSQDCHKEIIGKARGKQIQIYMDVWRLTLGLTKRQRYHGLRDECWLSQLITNIYKFLVGFLPDLLLYHYQ